MVRTEKDEPSLLGRLVRVGVGILLLPLGVAAVRTLFHLVVSMNPGSLEALSPSTWGLVLGFLLWILLYYIVPRPIRTYVLAHELTHALWAYLMGAGVSQLKVSKTGGSVTLTKNNALITLAPYFFPFYTVCVILVYGMLSLFLDMRGYEPFWLGLVGLSWGFHLTFTLSLLAQYQTDITRYGYLFSYSLIFLLNILGICWWIVAVTPLLFEGFLERWVGDIAWVLSGLEPVWGRLAGWLGGFPGG